MNNYAQMHMVIILDITLHINHRCVNLSCKLLPKDSLLLIASHTKSVIQESQSLFLHNIDTSIGIELANTNKIMVHLTR
jgi:hypothetical protein